MTTTDEHHEDRRSEAEGPYAIILDGAPAGFAEFVAGAKRCLVFPHTQLDRAFSGRGLGTELIGQAMTDVASRGETVVPECSFVVRYLQKHEVNGLDIAWPHGSAPQG